MGVARDRYFQMSALARVVLAKEMIRYKAGLLEKFQKPHRTRAGRHAIHVAEVRRLTMQSAA